MGTVIQYPMVRSGFALLGSCVLLFALACGAPAAEPMRGGAGEALDRAIRSGAGTFDHTAWDEILRSSVRDGSVDYESAAAHRADLDAYLARVASADLSALSRDEAFAFLANAYNALTVRSILEHPGVSSIRDISGVWTERRHRVAGFDLTLDEIEHRLLRPYFHDARVHFAINCASRSCAPLLPRAWRGEGLDAALDAATRAAIARPAFLRIDDDAIRVTAYLDWFADDFRASYGGPREFLLRYAPAEKAEWIRAHPSAPIRHLDYDWSLNAARP